MRRFRWPDLRRFARSFRHASEGVVDVYRSQRHMRVHFLFMSINAVLALVYKLEALEVGLLMVVITMVVVAEMINTVIEATLNIVTETYHPVARFAKDVAAGAVLVCTVNACLVGAFIYFRPEQIERLRRVWVQGDYVDNSAFLRALAMSVLILMVLITALKVGRPQKSVVHGKPISGHTAFAFCLAACVYFLVRDTSFALVGTSLVAIIALLVAQLRLHDANHDSRSVLYGAALGILVPLLIFQWLARPTLMPPP